MVFDRDALDEYTYLVYLINPLKYTSYPLMKMTFDFFDVSAMRSSLYFSHKERIDQKAKKKGGL